MKRYLITILLSIMCVASIGSFFIYTALDQLPDYKLETILGDPGEAKHALLSGNYFGRIRSEYLEISAAGSMYQSERYSLRNYLNPRGWFYEHPEIMPLIRDYRGFMRGKYSLTSFYQDEEWLIYAVPELHRKQPGSGELVASVDVLHRPTGDVYAFETQLDADAQGRHPYIADVQLIGDELHLLIGLVHDTYEYKDYIVNITDRSFDRAVALMAAQSAYADGRETRGASYVGPADDSAPSDLAMISMLYYERTGEEGYQRIEQLLSYRYSTGETEVLPEWSSREYKDESFNYQLSDEMLSLGTKTSSSFSVKRYGLMPYQEAQAEYVYTAEQLGGRQIWSTMIWKDRAYALAAGDKRHVLSVIDLNNGEMVYQGEVVLDRPNSDASANVQMLDIRNLTLNLRGD